MAASLTNPHHYVLEEDQVEADVGGSPRCGAAFEVQVVLLCRRQSHAEPTHNRHVLNTGSMLAGGVSRS